MPTSVNNRSIEPNVKDLDTSSAYSISENGVERQSGRYSDANPAHFDYWNDVEWQLKLLWSDYVQSQEKYGFNANTKSLKEKYFNLYRSYRRNRNWNKIISDL